MPRKVGKKIGGNYENLTETNLDGIAIINNDKYYIVENTDISNVKNIINYEGITIDRSDDKNIISLPFYNNNFTITNSTTADINNFIIKLNYILYCLSTIKDVLKLLLEKNVNVDQLKDLISKLINAKNKVAEAAKAAATATAATATATAATATAAAAAAAVAATATAAAAAAAVAATAAATESEKEVATAAAAAATATTATQIEAAAQEAGAQPATYDFKLDDVDNKCVAMVKEVYNQYKSYDGLTDVFYIIRYRDSSSQPSSSQLSYKYYLFIVDNLTIFDYSKLTKNNHNINTFVNMIYNHFTKDNKIKQIFNIT
jgi:predicted phage tail protein